LESLWNETEETTAPRAAGGRSVFAGDLAEFGLVDIAQTMMMGRKSGCLTVRRGKHVGYFYFLDGEIVYVIDDQFLQGLQAALQIFCWQEGSFEFDFSKAPPGTNITITTESLLFEVARQLDEMQAQAQTRAAKPARKMRRPRGGTTSQNLQDRHMEKIRDLFAQIAERVRPEVQGGGRIAPRGSSVETWLKRLTPQTGDAIFLIPGLTPKLKSGGNVQNLDGPKVDPDSIERFVRTVLDRSQLETLRSERSVELLVEVGEAAPARLVVSGEGQKKMIVAHLLHKVADLFANAAEPSPFLKDIVDLGTGLVLIGGGPSSGKSRLLSSLIRHRAEARGSLIFLLSRIREFLFDNSNGLILQKSLPKGSVDFSDTLRVCLAQNPDLVALDGLGGPGVMEPVFRAASTGRAILGTIEADTPQEAVDFAGDFLERKRDTIASKLFHENLKGILFVERTDEIGEERLGFRIRYFLPNPPGERLYEPELPGGRFGLRFQVEI